MSICGGKYFFAKIGRSGYARNMENGKPTIDERLEAIGVKLELLTVNVHAMQEENAARDRRVAALDRQERRARKAIAEGIVAYFKALNEEPDQSFYDQA